MGNIVTRLKERFSSQKLRKTFKALALFLLIAAIPVTVVLVQQQLTIQQQVYAVYSFFISGRTG